MWSRFRCCKWGAQGPIANSPVSAAIRSEEEKQGLEKRAKTQSKPTDPPTFVQVELLLGHVLLQVGDDFVHVLRVLHYAAQLLLVKVGSDLLAQQDLADDVAQVGGSSSVLCGPNKGFVDQSLPSLMLTHRSSWTCPWG